MAERDRIDQVITELQLAWRNNPHLRLTQLVACLTLGPGESCPVMFHTEDDVLLERLQVQNELGRQ